jgi:SAM-dependent methyltransferase
VLAFPQRLAGLAERLAFPEAVSPAEHWQREVMNASIADRIDALDPPSRTAAEISGEFHADRGWREYVSLSFPSFDLSASLTERRRFDVVICEQVIEHVPDPWQAAANLRGLCRDGAHVIVSTPFLVRVHELPAYGMRDYWRFTPTGLRTLLESAELEVDEVHSWGNRQCVVGNFSRWSARRAWHSLRNEPEYPLQVWAFARRPYPSAS